MRSFWSAFNVYGRLYGRLHDSFQATAICISLHPAQLLTCILANSKAINYVSKATFWKNSPFYYLSITIYSLKYNNLSSTFKCLHSLNVIYESAINDYLITLFFSLIHLHKLHNSQQNSCCFGKYQSPLYNSF